MMFFFFTDKTGERFFHITGWWLSVVVGYIIAFSTSSIAARYVSLFFMAGGYVGEYTTFHIVRMMFQSSL